MHCLVLLMTIESRDNEKEVSITMASGAFALFNNILLNDTILLCNAST